RRCEWELADLVIANSEFTKSTYIAAGCPEKKIEVVPYGAPPTKDQQGKGEIRREQPLRLLWAGTLSIRKGAHYLLEAWNAHFADAPVELRAFGACELPKRFTANLPKNIHL